MTDTNVAHSLVHTISVAHLTDAELLAGTRRLVGRSNQLLAELLAHLGEVESRGIHRTRACSSLYTYCIYELRFSEDVAFRRVAAARLVKRFPVLLDAIASGELHLTGLLMLGPHLTESNLSEVLARAKHRTKRELGRLVRVLDPLPAVPARIEPLGPAPARGSTEAPTWQVFVQSLCPVRELEPGERPRDWLGSASDADGTHRGDDADGNDPVRGDENGAVTVARRTLPEPVMDSALPAPARVHAKVEPLAPERYKVQFTATEEYVRLVEEAKALLSHAAPGARLEEIHLRAMRAFVSTLKKKKYATKQGALLEESRPAPDSAPANGCQSKAVPAHPRPQHRCRRDAVAASGAPAVLERMDQSEAVPTHPRQRGRHISAAIRRAVFQRDGGRCTYVDASGKLCAETHRLEFHHLESFAAGGEHVASNLTLRCAAHNALAAEEDFGRERMQEKRSGGAHEPLREAMDHSVREGMRRVDSTGRRPT